MLAVDEELSASVLKDVMGATEPVDLEGLHVVFMVTVDCRLVTLLTVLRSGQLAVSESLP